MTLKVDDIMRLIKKRNKAFSMIELLIVIAIITFLSGIIFVYANDARIKARDAKRLSDLRTLQTAIEITKKNSDNDVAPMPQSWSEFKTILAQEISKIPSDPQNSNEYHYVYCHFNDAEASNKKGKYIIAAAVENKKLSDDDLEIIIPGLVCVGSNNTVANGINCNNTTGNLNGIDPGLVNSYCIGYF